MTIQTINPATGKALHTYPLMQAPEVQQIIQDTEIAYQTWREFSFAQRAEKFQRLVTLLDNNKQHYAKIITEEMGKPIKAAIAEIEKCQWVCNYYIENAQQLLADRYVKTEMQKSYVSYKPLGIIFAIMPWNFPFWQVFRFAAPTLMAGNAVLLRHAAITTGVGLAIEELFNKAGFPANLFRTLLIDHDVATEVIRHPAVQGITLTGSGRAGSIIGSEAGTALKKIVLELGGNDPYIILADADIELAATACVASRMNNSGQVCIAAKRIIIVDEIFDQFEEVLLKKLTQYKMGDPSDPSVNMGPLAREDLRETVHKQVSQCLKLGATLVQGGEIPKMPGFYYPPTVLKNITANMPAMTEEIFGPVISLINAKNEAEAITIANDTQFGLSGAIFTQDIARGEIIARDKINVGSCYVNALVSSDPRLPFGGILNSGYGRELGAEGIHEFVNAKTICVR